MKKEQLEKLTAERNNPCVTISLKTHRTSPDNQKDDIRLKNLLNEASERLIAEFGKRPVQGLLEKISHIGNEIDAKQNLNSLHIFLSDSTKEVIKSPWDTAENTVQISDRFAIKPLIKLFNRIEEYLILLLSQSGVRLYKAVNDSIVEEIENGDFPFAENPHYLDDREKLSDAKQVDNMILEYFNKIDKALVKVHRGNQLNCVVICTESNYSKLMQVADLPSVYHGYIPVNYHETSPHHIVTSAWDFVQKLQKQRRTEAIEEMQNAVSQGKVVTDISEIFRAAKEGRGDLLIAHNDFRQAVKMTGEFTFDLADDNATGPEVIEDVTSEIAGAVISRKGRVIFTNQDEIKSLGKISLKVRF